VNIGSRERMISVISVVVTDNQHEKHKYLQDTNVSHHTYVELKRVYHIIS
jgi:hypothetical protein